MKIIGLQILTLDHLITFSMVCNLVIQTNRNIKNSMYYKNKSTTPQWPSFWLHQNGYEMTTRYAVCDFQRDFEGSKAL